MIVLIALVGYVLFYGQLLDNQESVKVYKPVEVESQTTPKPPPPGETAESGHWHGDVWHAEPHKPVAVSEAETELTTPSTELTEAQSTPVGAQQVNAQSPAPMQDSSRTRPPQEVAEIQRQQREWVDKDYELRIKVSQAHQAWAELIPETVEEAKRYQTDKEWQRKAQEAADKYDEVLEILKEHETNRVLPPAQ